jgi:hypothetical protein
MELLLAVVLVSAIAFALMKGFDKLGDWWDEHGGGGGWGAVIAAIIGTGITLMLFAAVRSAATRSP